MEQAERVLLRQSIWLLLILWLIALLASRIEPGPAAGIWSLDGGLCSLDFFTQPAQPVRTLVLACPGVDAIRLWPWPPVQPWYEDPDEPGQPDRMPAGRQASLPGTEVGQI